MATVKAVKVSDLEYKVTDGESTWGKVNRGHGGEWIAYFGDKPGVVVRTVAKVKRHIERAYRDFVKHDIPQF
jgi:hypothetical protein